MKSIDESEQWKLGGQCSKCRRQKYCGTACKAARTSDRREIQQLVANHMFGRFMKAVKSQYNFDKEVDIFDRPD